MSGDYSRNTAYADIQLKDKKARFLMGRSITDAQLNANTDLLEAQREIALTDVIGHVGFPKENAGFGLRADTGGGLALLAGHMYLDGVLFENDADLTYSPNLPDDVPHVAYFVGEKTEYNYLSRDFIRDPALGGPDTAGRSRVGGTMILAALSDVLEFADIASEAVFKSRVKAGDHIPMPHCGFGDAAAKFSIDLGEPRDDEACLIKENARYKGQDNINYHAEIHDPSSSGSPTFKWARHFVQARLDQNTDGDFILIGNVDGALMAFKDQGCVEIRDAHMVTTNQPGTLVKITDNGDGTYSLPAAIAADFATMPPPVMVRRWDHDPDLHPSGVPAGPGPVKIENGVQIEFRGDLVSGDHWQCAARFVSGDILWPPIPVPDGFVGPFNWRRCAVLGIVKSTDEAITIVDDLRNLFPNLTHIDAKDVSFSSNKCNFGSDTPTVHHALLKICSRIDKNGCTIRVRPDDIEDISNVPYLGVDHYPTLSEVLGGLSEFFKKTAKTRVAREFRARIANTAEADLRAEVLAAQPGNRGRLLGPQAGPTMRVSANVPAAGGRNAFFERFTLTGGLSPAILDAINEATIPFNPADSVAEVAAPAAAAPEPDRINPFFLYRRLSIEFLPGDYTWPEGFTELFKNMSAICLKSCCDGNVNLSSAESLVFLNCINVSLKGINLFFGENEAQLTVRGGKHIAITDSKLTRAAVKGLPLASLAAKTRIKIRDTRFRLTHVKDFSEIRLGVHIENSRAHTSFNDVQCNGFVILGEGVPTTDQDPTADILETSKGKVLNVDGFVPFRTNTQSNNTARVESCRFYGLIPGGLLLRAAESWASSRGLRAAEKRVLPFRALHVQDSELQEGYNIFLAKTVMLRDNRFSDFGDNVCVPGNAIMRDGFILNVEDKSPVYQTLLHIVMDPKTQRRRFWAPVGFVIAKRASIHSNIGFRDKARAGEKSFPLILDLSKRDFEFGLEYEMEQTVYEMTRLNMLVFHSVYLKQR
ncbi:hypothetical protein N9W89_07665 [Hellea sp.]|nr:hypothetical protein [Hellea sp.]